LNVTPRALPVLVLSMVLAGCETTERINPGGGDRGVAVRDRNDPGEEKVTREDALLKHLEEHPEDAASWWRLGTYYERVSRFPEAIKAYQKLAELCEAAARKDGMPYTAGLFHLGVCYAKARQYAQAVDLLRQVLSLQPKDDREASLNKQFREAHYWLGAVYYEHRQWQPAREHFLAFKRIGGPDERVDPWLLRIEEFEGDALIKRSGSPPPTDPRRAQAPRGKPVKPAEQKPAGQKPAEQPAKPAEQPATPAEPPATPASGTAEPPK
jgi:tetratricopeptide (TPR) repeat protein